MRGGKILQQGTCDEVLQKPIDPYVITLKNAGYWMIDAIEC
jgi:ABC-type proline/glycine betaine transport system ATPase subunit